MLEFIWTRLARDFNVGNLWGEDLTIEALHAFLLGSVEERDGALGWNYKYITANNTELASVADYDEWQPTRLSLEQFTIIQELCAGHVVRIDDEGLHSYLEKAGTAIDEFAESLIRTRLVARAGNEMQLITIQCQPVILPNGDFVAGENNTGRMTRWLARYRENLDE